MKAALKIVIVLVLLFIAACENPDEIVPNPPVAVPTLVQPVPEPASEEPDKKPPFNLEAEKYQYGQVEDMPYRILMPRNYNPTLKYPLVIFLHGMGESGTDNGRQLTWGASLFQADSIREKYPAFVIFPQCPETEYWFNGWGKKKVKALIDTVTESYLVDKAKIYIGGLSMGAYGTFAIVADNPELFAAAVAISGDGNLKKANDMARTKWRIFAGKKDEVVPSSKTEKMATALVDAGASVSFTIYPHTDHMGTWMKAFAEPDFCQWLFSKQRKIKASESQFNTSFFKKLGKVK
jgi:predicted peptidase